jgi:hypothetical protein
MTKATRVAFSKTRLEGIPTPESGQAQYHDTGCLGLCLRVSCGGSKTFIRYGKIGGRPTRVFLGRFPEVTVEMARKACQAAAGDIARGLNPHAERLAKRREHTLQGLFDHWMIYAREHKKPKSVEGDDWLFKRYLQPWAGRRLSSIKKADVQTHHAKIGREHGRYAANRMLALLRAMFNKADEVGYTGDNPAKGIKKFSEEKRDRFLQGDELPRFFQSLHQEPEQFRDFFSLALLTGARRAAFGESPGRWPRPARPSWFPSRPRQSRF